MTRLAALGIAVALVVTACGNTDTGGTVDAGPTTTGHPVDVALVVDVANATTGSRSGSVTCAGPAATGTGAFLEQTAAAGACAALLHDAESKRRLTQGPQTGGACTQQYGGPAQAHVSGTFQGTPVDTTFDRHDGCSIADWDRLTYLLGPP